MDNRDNDIPYVMLSYDDLEYYGGNKLKGEQNTIIASIWGGGVEANLILYTPNTKNITNIEETPYFEQFKEFQGDKIDEELIIKLHTLKKDISNYCYAMGLYTYESKLAIELDIYDFRDNVMVI